MVPGKTYDIQYNYITIGGHRIGGFGDEGVAEYEHASDVVEVAVGADGEVTFSRTNNFLMFVNITVKENSRSVRILDELFRAQQATPTILPLPYIHRDVLNGDQVRDQYAVFVQIPGPNKGRTASDRVFRLALPNGRRNQQLATTSLI